MRSRSRQKDDVRLPKASDTAEGEMKTDAYAVELRPYSQLHSLKRPEVPGSLREDGKTAATMRRYAMLTPTLTPPV
jgi:hypothetical protein